MLSWRDHCPRAIRTPILERPVLDIQNPGTSEIRRRGNGSISNRDDTLSFSKLLKLAGFFEPDTDIATRCRPLKYDNGIEAFLIRAHHSPAAIDLEPVRLNGNLELPGAGIRPR